MLNLDSFSWWENAVYFCFSVFRSYEINDDYLWGKLAKIIVNLIVNVQQKFFSRVEEGKGYSSSELVLGGKVAMPYFIGSWGTSG